MTGGCLSSLCGQFAQLAVSGHRINSFLLPGIQHLVAAYPRECSVSRVAHIYSARDRLSTFIKYTVTRSLPWKLSVLQSRHEMW